VYALVGVEAAERGALDLAAGAGLPSAPSATSQPVLHHAGGTRLSLQSSSRIAVDLTDLAPSFPGGRVADAFISLGVSVTSPSAAVITSATFYADANDDGRLEAASAPSAPVEVRPTTTGYAFLPLFRDVDWDYWDYRQIEACFQAGIVSGFPDDTYHPGVSVTRDQMAVYISRALAGSDAAVPGGPTAATFTDVPTDYWAYRYVTCAVARGVVQGYADGTYQPGRVVNRGAMAVFLARALAGGDAAVLEPTSAAAAFPDVPADFWAYRHVQYLRGTGVISGYPDGLYHPDYAVTRDAMAAYITRAFGLAK